MNAPMLAKKYQGRLPAGRWHVEPKLDGARALWDGAGTLYGRSLAGLGQALHNPPEVLDALRQSCQGIQLDGELYGGSLGETMSVLRTQRPVPGSSVRYYVFDLLAVDGDSLCGQSLETRRQRLEQLSRCWPDSAPLSLLPSLPLGGKDAESVARVLVDEGFEGAMLKRASSPYLAGVRSAEWLKVKFVEETDATILGAEAGENRLADSLGALLVKTEQGQQFKVGGGFTDEERRRLWQLHQSGQLTGLTISLTYQADKKICGRFPIFLRVRDDLATAATKENR